MKNVMKLFLFAAILFVPAAVFAQGSGSSYPPPQPSGSAGAVFGEEDNFSVTRSTSGTIVGLKQGVLTIKTDKDKEVQIALVKETKFKVGKKNLNVDELSDDLFKAGKPVKITYKPFAGRNAKFDKVAVEIRFEKDKEKKKPEIG